MPTSHRIAHPQVHQIGEVLEIATAATLRGSGQAGLNFEAQREPRSIGLLVSLVA